jgi:alpha-mannosidase
MKFATLRRGVWTITLMSSMLLGRLCFADVLVDKLTAFQPKLDDAYSVQLNDWRFHQPDVAGGEQSSTDDSGWQKVAPGYSWHGENTNVWFRTRIVIPESIGGIPTDGMPVRLDLGVDDDGELYIDGKLRELFHWDDCRYTLTESAKPGQAYDIAVRGMNGPGDGQLRVARLVFDVLPDNDRLATDLTFLDSIAKIAPASDAQLIQASVRKSEAAVDTNDVSVDRLAALSAELKSARAALMPVASITRKYRVYYVAHAHIDMNWEWTWPQTIDFCKRTWNSALNLMGSFPDLGFVQSQPGAYVPIQQQYPAEFAGIKRAIDRGQWEPVGGLWDESDTDIPSGEGLARSLLLGQTYFHDNFGRYADVAWLPDSFGHSGQLPQLFQLAGMHSFYHMRCGDGLPLTWWEGPDGSRVLKANTDSYDDNVKIDQLSEPFKNDDRFGVKQSLVVFGLGDHGGGPTREQILTAKKFQSDPILPEVRLVTAGQFFKQIAADPNVSALPVLTGDLQYVFEGCYSVHADIKTAIRQSENRLYTAEALSTLASTVGVPYPAKRYDEAWKPAAFAQFHDIACGTAIRSTYDWMHALLDPQIAYAGDQSRRTASTLTSDIDTRGAKHGEVPVAVWNSLSFSRDDVVRVDIPQASRYRSVRDASGHRYPAQAGGDNTLVFIARNVPGFGSAMYFASTAPAPKSSLTLSHLPSPKRGTSELGREAGGEGYASENAAVRLVIDGSTGAVDELVLKKTGWNAIAPGQNANVFQLVGDVGNSWVINRNGTEHTLLSDGAKVSVIARGPVFTTVRVTHALDKSTYTQDVTVYDGLTRVDVPTVVDWHEHGQMLKVAFPVNEKSPHVRVAIPYGSIARSTGGQEVPGQKWMDITDETRAPVTDAKTIDISGLLNNDAAANFDGRGCGYAKELLPTVGRHAFGQEQVPFELPSSAAGVNNLVCDGQSIPLPRYAPGSTLFLLGAASGARKDILRLNSETRARAVIFSLNDWVVGSEVSNELGLSMAHRSCDAVAPSLWIDAVPLPAGVASITMPSNPDMHIFAATVAVRHPLTASQGLTVLNDSKYGCDTKGNVFRLTALRWSPSPDPNSDEGQEVFTYSMLPHVGDWRTSKSEQAGLGLNIPLLAVVTPSHGPRRLPMSMSLRDTHGYGDLVAGTLKRSADGRGYILRFFETQGRDTTAELTFSQPVHVEEDDILERPIKRHRISTNGKTVRLAVGHDQIVTLRILGLSEAVNVKSARR